MFALDMQRELSLMLDMLRSIDGAVAKFICDSILHSESSSKIKNAL